jgi:putative hydrolase of the HAD superfamily
MVAALNASLVGSRRWFGHGGWPVSDARALVFDLDDTLYPYRQFVSSGFRAVAARVEREEGIPAAVAARTLCCARVVGERGREVQYLCRALGLPAALVPTLVTLVREHTPTLRLPERSRQVLQRLRQGWRLGILTNGSPIIQVRKMAALGVTSLVDAVVCASDCGDGRGKPASDGFHEVLQRLDTPPGSAVFVGDDGPADMFGAANVGMRTIHLRRAGRTGAPHTHVDCDAVVTTLWRVPEIAERLVSRGARHVA